MCSSIPTGLRSFGIDLKKQKNCSFFGFYDQMWIFRIRENHNSSKNSKIPLLQNHIVNKIIFNVDPFI